MLVGLNGANIVVSAGLRLIHAGNARLSRHHVVPVRRSDESQVITPRERVLNVKSRHGSVGPAAPLRSVPNSLGINLPLAEKAFHDEKPLQIVQVFLTVGHRYEIYLFVH